MSRSKPTLQEIQDAVDLINRFGGVYHIAGDHEAYQGFIELSHVVRESDGSTWQYFGEDYDYDGDKEDAVVLTL